MSKKDYPTNIKMYYPIFVSGPHGAGKTTLTQRLLNNHKNMFMENSFDIDFVKEFPSIKFLTDFERSLLRLYHRIFRTYYAYTLAKKHPRKIILTNRSVYDSEAYIKAYTKRKLISDDEFNRLSLIIKNCSFTSYTIIMNPRFNIIKERLQNRKKKGMRKKRDALFKHEDLDDFVQLLHKSFKKFQYHPNILYIEDNSNKEIEKIIRWIKRINKPNKEF